MVEGEVSDRSRSERVAATILVLSFLVISVDVSDRILELPVRELELAAFVVLIGGDVMSRRVRLAPELVRTGAFIPPYVLLVLSVLYPLLHERGAESEFGTFFASGVGYTVAYSVAAVYCALYYSSERLLAAFWTWTRILLGLAIVAYVVSVALGEEYLVNLRFDRTFRLQGLMSEPSAWAPVLAILAVESMRRKSVRWLAATGVAILLTRSPTVLLVVGISVPLYFLITGRGGDRRAKILLAGAIFVPASIWYIGAGDPGSLLESESALVRTIGRLMAGVQGDAEGSEFATNRAESTRYVWDEVWRGGDALLGRGPGASDAHFDFTIIGELSQRTIAVRANNLWIEMFFNFGLVGLTLFVILVVVVVRRLSRDADASVVLLPFIVAAMINSASGFQAYQFVAIALFAFGFGIRPRRAAPPSTEAAIGGVRSALGARRPTPADPE